MSFQPQALTPEYSMVESRDCYAHLKDLKFPDDKQKIAYLSLAEKQVWYAAQDPHALIESGEDFHQFWFLRYLLPLRLKRIAFWFKFW